MTVFRERPIMMWLIMVVAIMGLAGCSADAPYESSNNETLVSGGPSDLMPPPADGNVLFVAEVATIDQDQRMITFVDRDEVVIVAEDCQIVEIIAGVATDIELLDIEVGMRVKVCGILQEDETVLAHKICV